MRKKEIIIVSHCVLNQNSVINGWERAPGAFNHVVHNLLDRNIGIIQLPCPELKHLGLNRPPQTKMEYNTKAYRILCSDLAKEMVGEIVTYRESGYKIVGLIGIGQSPTCDTLGNKGLFMEALFDELNDKQIQIPTLDIPESYEEGQMDMSEALKKFLDQS